MYIKHLGLSHLNIYKTTNANLLGQKKNSEIKTMLTRRRITLLNNSFSLLISSKNKSGLELYLFSSSSTWLDNRITVSKWEKSNILQSNLAVGIKTKYLRCQLSSSLYEFQDFIFVVLKVWRENRMNLRKTLLQFVCSEIRFQ